MSANNYFIGVDVGTGSARAALVSTSGEILAESTYATTTYRDERDSDIFEQSTTEIWDSISKACKDVLRDAKVSKDDVKGIGFDATCSLAVTNKEGVPMSVTKNTWGAGEGKRDIILWADHRARKEAAEINATGSSVLKYVGETMSLEMELPKIVWLKRNMPAELFAQSMFFDLPDYLTYRATSDLARSNCSLACKCSYVPPEIEGSKGWNAELFETIGLSDIVEFSNHFASGYRLAKLQDYLHPIWLSSSSASTPSSSQQTLDDGRNGSTDASTSTSTACPHYGTSSLSPHPPSSAIQAKDGFRSIGGVPGETGLVLTAGQPVGKGLSAQAAQELALNEGTAVGSGAIDAYAGWIGTIAAPMPDLGISEVNLKESRHRLAAIAGTSTCHIVQSPEAVFVPGVWGPYLHAVFHGYWMNEGGQSSTGQLLDFMLETHPAWNKLLENSKQKGINHFVYLGELLDELMKEEQAPFLTYLTKDLHIYPDLHGNRSPLADNAMRGAIVGLKLDRGVKDLALRYLATCEAIALQTRHIIEEMNKRGHDIKYLFMSGGLVKNKVLMQLLADICKMPVQLPFSHSASVVLGSAMLGAAAYAEHTKKGDITSQDVAGERSKDMSEELWSLMTRMSRPGSTVLPKENNEKERKLLEVKYKIFHAMIDQQRQFRKDVEEALA